MSDKTLTEKLDAAFEGLRPELPEEPEDRVSPGDELLMRSPAIWAEVKAAREAKAADAAKAAENAELFRAFAEAGEATGMSATRIRERLERPEGEIELAKLLAEDHEETAGERRIKEHERQADVLDAEPEADEHRVSAEAIRRDMAWEQNEEAALIAATEARYYPPEPEAEAAEGGSQ